MYILISIIMIAVLVAVDQIIKFWAASSLEPVGTMHLLRIGKQRIIDLTYVENDGAVFGSFGGKRIILIVVTTILVCVCAYFLYRYKTSSKLMFISLNMIIAGGIGNWIDRVFRNGLVVDYIEIKLFNFAVFNFADICITLGVAFILIYILFIEKRDGKKEEVAANAK